MRAEIRLREILEFRSDKILKFGSAGILNSASLKFCEVKFLKHFAERVSGLNLRHTAGVSANVFQTIACR